MCYGSGALSQQQQVNRRRVGSQDMDVDEADYYETQVAEDYGVEDVEDDEYEYDDLDDSEQACELKVRNSSLLACRFDTDTKMAHLGSTPVLAQLNAHITACFAPLTSSTDARAGTPHSEIRCAVSTIAQSSSWVRCSCCGHQ